MDPYYVYERNRCLVRLEVYTLSIETDFFTER